MKVLFDGEKMRENSGAYHGGKSFTIDILETHEGVTDRINLKFI